MMKTVMTFMMMMMMIQFTGTNGGEAKLQVWRQLWWHEMMVMIVKIIHLPGKSGGDDGDDDDDDVIYDDGDDDPTPWHKWGWGQTSGS